MKKEVFLFFPIILPFFYFSILFHNSSNNKIHTKIHYPNSKPNIIFSLKFHNINQTLNIHQKSIKIPKIPKSSKHYIFITFSTFLPKHTKCNLKTQQNNKSKIKIFNHHKTKNKTTNSLPKKESWFLIEKR